MTNISEILPDDVRDTLEKKSQPQWIKPMLATLTSNRFSDPDWIYERKLDGERCLVFKSDKSVKLFSRNKKCLNETYPEIIDALLSQQHTFIADGELVAFAGDITSFSKLQQRMHGNGKESDVRVYYYLFDLMHINEFNVTGAPLRERKKLLKECIRFDDPIRYCVHKNEKGEEYFEDACRKGWEGIIAKDAQSPYVHSRSKKWLKFKCENRQELVIGGFTEPQGSRKGFGALLVGYYDEGTLKYAGKVGTGFSDDLLASMHSKMERLEIDENPFEQEQINERNVHWIEPELVGEFQFTEWTKENRLRHPSFVGLRDDKNARKVIKEA
jgi:DNA ligase D-like protein (predicted ligase)